MACKEADGSLRRFAHLRRIDERQQIGYEKMIWSCLGVKKPDFTGDFQRSNLSMWDIRGCMLYA
jgi:hypothetical protein